MDPSSEMVYNRYIGIPHKGSMLRPMVLKLILDLYPYYLWPAESRFWLCTVHFDERT